MKRERAMVFVVGILPYGMRTMRGHMSRFLLAAVLATSAGSAFAADRVKQEFKVSLRVDFGDDTGQSLGTLFEILDADSKPIAGAGFHNAYNTQDRSDRRLVHFYLKTAGDEPFNPEPIPRPTDDGGTYLFGLNNRMYSYTRSGIDTQLRAWDEAKAEWHIDERTVPLSFAVGSGIVSFDQRHVAFDGKPILELNPEQGLIAEPYAANGHLLFRKRKPDADPAGNELAALLWRGSSSAVNPATAISQPLNTPGEFVYAWGQLGNTILAATNTGGVHAFDTITRKWSTHRVPDGKSFQIYAAINYENRLLLGQYPTGELFLFDGTKLAQLRHEPPVMQGVSTNAREAQTLAIYGGDLYAGVWPWGEVWRKDRRTNQWRFLGRMFTHPEPTDKTTHPYENETKALDPTLNRWGQRVTSFVPLGNSLYISTSAKGPNAYEEKFTFLAGGKWKEYGMVYRFQKPGSLAAPFEWCGGRLDLQFEFDGKQLTVRQNGNVIGTAACNHPSIAGGESVQWGEGVFGTLSGDIRTRHWSSTYRVVQ